MTRPEIIRADTIDLQAHENSTPDGYIAPHQAETLREVAAEAAEDNRSLPGSWNNDADTDTLYSTVSDSQQSGGYGIGIDDAGSMHTGTRQDALAIAQNGGLSGHEVDEADMDGETEVDMDDDMMDKISSSPSIEDGGFTSTFPTFPSCSSSSGRFLMRCSSDLSVIGDARSSSPYLASPNYLPPMSTDGETERHQAVERSYFLSPACRHHHLDGEFELHGIPDTPQPAITFSPANPHNFDPSEHELLSDAEDEEGISQDMRRHRATVTKGKGPSTWPPTRHISHRYEATPGYLPSREPTEQDASDDSFSDPPDMTVPYDSSSEDDDGDFSDSDDPRFVDSGWGGECLQESEDIDFEFVYALHTFVATVEGQANATKGDTMVLLDDSNSYWWLVRVVKDSSIGYLPAEHIETPTERLARLNKHRNIDLSASMLGDQTDKVRNPIKSAMKRRKTKTVQFAPPTFVDYSDIDYSTDEEDVAAEYFAQAAQQGQQNQQASAATDAEDETAKVEPLKPRTSQEDSTQDETDNSAKPRSSEDQSELKVDGPKKTSDGTVRDSFFKDDTVETKKITLTPNLLRDDDGTRLSSDSKEMRQRPSLDRLLDKEGLLGKDGKKGKDKKEKDKKPSAIRSFFSRKDKDKKSSHEDEDPGRDSHEREMDEEEVTQGSPEKPGPQRQPSKLQKQQPRTEPSPTRKPGSTREAGNGVDIKAFLSESKVNNVANVPPATMRLVESSPKGSPQGSPQTNGRPQKATKARTRMGLDDFDSDDDLDPEPVQSPTSQDVRRQQPSQQQRSAPNNTNPFINQQQAVGGQAVRSAPAGSTPSQQQKERLSESPVQVSPVTSSNPPPLMVDTSSQEEDRSSPRSTPSPEMVEHEDADTSVNKETITPSTSSRSSWNDANLRAFFDSGSDIRDLLVVVYDKSNVDPVASDHPVASSLFREQNAKLAEITTQLDNMLGDWLARKQRLRGTV
ncbi:hypothetical protein QBC40DRAFT_19236 [Triangularia verruculosa]|uniref:SH3 domain-containing protein n=1 Tax=Triangularia verruculosa TaxID=2587418 RepID=A0AAN7AR90_9PEZI|nr:hypothetical protein QBC40DRAFT_19236 [Triangularia verruculosa]